MTVPLAVVALVSRLRSGHLGPAHGPGRRQDVTAVEIGQRLSDCLSEGGPFDLVDASLSDLAGIDQVEL